MSTTPLIPDFTADILSKMELDRLEMNQRATMEATRLRDEIDKEVYASLTAPEKPQIGDEVHPICLGKDQHKGVLWYYIGDTLTGQCVISASCGNVLYLPRSQFDVRNAECYIAAAAIRFEYEKGNRLRPLLSEEDAAYNQEYPF